LLFFSSSIYTARKKKRNKQINLVFEKKECENVVKRFKTKLTSWYCLIPTKHKKRGRNVWIFLSKIGIPSSRSKADNSLD